MRRKVAVIGAGFVGTMTAQRIAGRHLADVVLVDIVDGLPQGRALDMAQSAALEGLDGTVVGINDFSAVAGAEIVVFTAGFPRSPGMSCLTWWITTLSAVFPMPWMLRKKQP